MKLPAQCANLIYFDVAVFFDIERNARSSIDFRFDFSDPIPQSLKKPVSLPQKTIDPLLKRHLQFVGIGRLCFQKLISTIRQSALILMFLSIC
jgi:hypothetical protein